MRAKDDLIGQLGFPCSVKVRKWRYDVLAKPAYVECDL